MMKIIRWFFSCCSKIFVTSWVNSLTKFSEVTNQVLEIDWACLTINQLLISKKRAGTTASPICIFHWNPQMKECEKNPKPLSPVWFDLSPSPCFWNLSPQLPEPHSTGAGSDESLCAGRLEKGRTQIRPTVEKYCIVLPQVRFSIRWQI